MSTQAQAFISPRLPPIGNGSTRNPFPSRVSLAQSGIGVVPPNPPPNDAARTGLRRDTNEGISRVSRDQTVDAAVLERRRDRKAKVFGVTPTGEKLTYTEVTRRVLASKNLEVLVLKKSTFPEFKHGMLLRKQRGKVVALYPHKEEVTDDGFKRYDEARRNSEPGGPKRGLRGWSHVDFNTKLLQRAKADPKMGKTTGDIAEWLSWNGIDEPTLVINSIPGYANLLYSGRRMQGCTAYARFADERVMPQIFDAMRALEMQLKIPNHIQYWGDSTDNTRFMKFSTSMRYTPETYPPNHKYTTDEAYQALFYPQITYSDRDKNAKGITLKRGQSETQVMLMDTAFDEEEACVTAIAAQYLTDVSNQTWFEKTKDGQSADFATAKFFVEHSALTSAISATPNFVSAKSRCPNSIMIAAEAKPQGQAAFNAGAGYIPIYIDTITAQGKSYYVFVLIARVRVYTYACEFIPTTLVRKNCLYNVNGNKEYFQRYVPENYTSTRPNTKVEAVEVIDLALPIKMIGTNKDQAWTMFLTSSSTGGSRIGEGSEASAGTGTINSTNQWAKQFSGAVGGLRPTTTKRDLSGASGIRTPGQPGTQPAFPTTSRFNLGFGAQSTVSNPSTTASTGLGLNSVVQQPVYGGASGQPGQAAFDPTNDA